MVRRGEVWEEDQRSSYRRRIEKDPKNVGAYEALGGSLYQAGRMEEAREIYLTALDAAQDERMLGSVRSKLKQVDADIRERAQAMGRRSPRRPREREFCSRCGAPNPPLRRRCELCQASMPFNSYWDALRDKHLQRASLEGLCCVIIVVVLLRLLDFLPLDVRGAIIIATAIVVGWRFIQALDGARR
jgi:tetratricopeptide (TPR) repeat protein